MILDLDLTKNLAAKFQNFSGKFTILGHYCGQKLGAAITHTHLELWAWTSVPNLKVGSLGGPFVQLIMSSRNQYVINSAINSKIDITLYISTINSKIDITLYISTIIADQSMLECYN